MDPKANGVLYRFEALTGSQAAALWILLLATVLRFWKAVDWSLWIDELSSIYFSQHPHKAFPHSIPLFFYVLRALYQVTGISVPAGRLFVAALGVLSVGLTYASLRKLVDYRVALLAALLLTVSFGHIFWSQAIRYYMLGFVFQVLSAHCFIRGFEDDSRWQLLLSNLALLLALLTHFSAGLLIPVLAAYLALAFWQRRAFPAGYSLRNLLVFVVPFLCVSFFGVWWFVELRTSFGELVTSAKRRPELDLLFVSMSARLMGYYGVPVLAMASLAPLLACKLVPRRLLCFLMLCAFLPFLELAIITSCNLTFVTWYYVFFAFFGLSALAALGIVAVYQRGFRVSGVVIGAAVLAHQLFFVYGYFTTMHGDRPRWKEAVGLLQQKTGIDARKPGRAKVLSTAALVVAFYLGYPPDQAFEQLLVDPLPEHPPDVVPPMEQWYVVQTDVSFLSPEYAQWLAEHCVLEGRFEAKTGTKDRLLLVYHFSPRSCGGADPP